MVSGNLVRDETDPVPGSEQLTGAYARVAPHARRTPVIETSGLVRGQTESIWLKCENLQAGGSFKFRGALNAVLSIPEEEAGRGVATHSSGNHGAAVARAARLRGIQAWIVMPRDSRAIKQEGVLSAGGEIVFCEPGMSARQAGLAAIVERTGASVVHPYDDYRVIEGQGTVMLETLEQLDKPPDVVIVPAGGGGLLSGTALVANAFAPGTRVIGVEPERADDTWHAFHKEREVVYDKADTIADGLRAHVGKRNIGVIRRHVHDVVTVTEEAIAEAMQAIWTDTRLLVEPSAAVGIAALRSGLSVPGRKVVILTGANIDPVEVPWAKSHES